MTFMDNGIYVMGLKAADMTDTHQQIVNQVTFIRDHVGHNPVGISLLEKRLKFHVEFNAGGIDEIGECLSLLDYDFMAECPGFKEFYESWKPLMRGNEIPDFNFTDKEGKTFSLSSLKGKYIFIDCWASWCGPCRAQVPALKELEKKFHDKDIVFVGKSSDNNKDKWIKAMEELGLEGYQVQESDTSHPFDSFFKVTGIPRFILLDKEGKILRAVMSRPSMPETEAFLKTLDL